MNIIILILFVITGAVPITSLAAENPAPHEINNNGQNCITEERIIKPTASWKVLKTEIRYQDEIPFLEISNHNPLNKETPESIDAKFIFSMDPSMPSDVQQYGLVMAFYYNSKANVTFKRIYSVCEAKNKTKKFKIQTPCFERTVVPIIVLEEETKIQINIPDDDGVDKKEKP